MSACEAARTWVTVPGAEFGEVGPQRLDGIDDQERRRPVGGERRQNVLDAGLGGDLHGGVGQRQALGPQADLGHGLLAGDIDHRLAGGGELPRHLQQQGRLADAGIATDQQRRAAHEAAAGHPVELGDAGADARGVVGGAGKGGQRHRAALAELAGCRARPDAAAGALFDQRVPFAAVIALALPARGDGAAVLAGEA